VRKHPLTWPVVIVLLAGSAGTAVAAQDGAGPAGLVTEVVEPGVERIVRDDAGHDLDETHPMHRYDMDRIAIAPDGTVWLSSTYSRGDNGAHPEAGAMVWALGKPGTYGVRSGTPPESPSTYLYIGADGRKTLVTIEVTSSQSVSSIPDLGWAGPPSGMTPEGQAVLVARTDGVHACRARGRGVTCEAPSGELTTYLKGTRIDEVAAAPDGTIWAVGGYKGDNGGLYRITLG
jgi:hypothetical protein